MQSLEVHVDSVGLEAHELVDEQRVAGQELHRHELELARAEA